MIPKLWLNGRAYSLALWTSLNLENEWAFMLLEHELSSMHDPRGRVSVLEISSELKKKANA